MKCPECRSDNQENSKFCHECGYYLAKRQVSKNETQSAKRPYTPKFLTDNILVSKSATEGERKLVTVLFADVANYTAMAERLDPEDTHHIMGECFTILMDEIHNYQGTINQFTGDGIMALFGAPAAQENHAQEACYAALSIQKAVKKFAAVLKEKYDIDWTMRIGLNSGPVVVGAIGDDLRTDYTAIGDTTNLAARLESMAEPGTILVSPNVYDKARSEFEFSPRGKADIKGKRKPIEIYELKKKIFRQRVNLDRMIQSEMIGRDEDLNRLELQILKAVNGEGSIVSIIGEAGIGKSRLIAELKKRDVMNRVTFLEGRSVSMGKNLSFHPIIDVLKLWAGIWEDDGESVALEKLKKTIMAVSPADADEIFPFVATLMGLKLSGRYAERINGIEGEALERLIAKNVRGLLEKAAKIKPLVISIEDLHWSDQSSIELLESLFRLAETNPILFINVFRPGYEETGDKILSAIKNKLSVYHKEIMLRPLDVRLSEELINNMLHIRGLHHAVKNQIIERAGGNPFFIEEVVRSFIDEGIVVIKDGEFHVTSRINQAVIPPTINDVLMARIDRLDEETRDLVKVASVIGRRFFYRILVDIIKNIDDVDHRLEYLEDIQLIRGRERMEELEYLFKHVLAQEAAYASILQHKRKEIHLNVADSIEKVFKERIREFYGLLAYHYSKGEDIDKAEAYMAKAGEEALRASASSEAINYYQEGLNLYLSKYGDAADPDKLVMFEKNIAIALFNKGKQEEAVRYIDSALQRWGIRYPRNRVLRSAKFIFDLSSVIRFLYFSPIKSKKIPDQRQNEIFKVKEMKISALVHLNPRRGFSEQISGMRAAHRFDVTKIENGVFWRVSPVAQFAYTGISFTLCRKFLGSCRDILDSPNPIDVFVYKVLSIVYSWSAGEWRSIGDYPEDLIEYNLSKGELWYVSIYIWVYGFVKIDMGELDIVRKLIKKLAQIWEHYEYEIARIFQYQLESDLALKLRNLVDARKEAGEGAAFSGEKGQPLHEMHMLGGKSLAQIYLKDYDNARKTLAQARDIHSNITYSPPCYITSYLMGQFLLEVSLLKEAMAVKDKLKISEHVRQANRHLERAKKNAARYADGRTEFLRMQAEYYWLLNKQKKSMKCFTKSIREGERIGAKIELARTYMAVGKCLCENNSKYHLLLGLDSREYLEKAGAVFTEMKLAWDLDELDRVGVSLDG